MRHLRTSGGLSQRKEEVIPERFRNCNHNGWFSAHCQQSGIKAPTRKHAIASVADDYFGIYVCGAPDPALGHAWDISDEQQTPAELAPQDTPDKAVYLCATHAGMLNRQAFAKGLHPLGLIRFQRLCSSIQTEPCKT